MIQSDTGILAILAGVCAFFFFLEDRTKWKFFQYFPPLIFIYLVPVLMSNIHCWPTGDGDHTTLIPPTSPVYSSIRTIVLPMMLVLLLLKVDVAAAIRVMGKGVFVMLFGTMGVVIGAPIGFLCVRYWLEPETWKAYGTLSGSWIGGTGNMAAVSDMISADGAQYGLAVLADTTIYIVWLPIMLGSKSLAGWFGRFTQVSEARLEKMEEAAKSLVRDESAPRFQDLLFLIFLALGVTWLAQVLAVEIDGEVAAGFDSLKEGLKEKSWQFVFVDTLSIALSESTWRILLITTLGIGLSFSPAKRIPGSHALAMAFVYLFVARMGASSDFSEVAKQAVPFVVGAGIMIAIHGAFCLLGAKLFRVDVHTAAIASAANIGGAASAPIVAAHHRESLVPASILLALIGYAVGNYAALLAAILCRLVSGGG